MSDSFDTPHATVEPVQLPTEGQVPVTGIPVGILQPVGTATTVSLSASSPSTTTTAPTSSVEVTVPGVSGTIQFSLVVTDNLGVKSAPAFATVTIQGPPVAVLTATPATVTEGGAIDLSGAGSTSSGSIASYDFSYVPVT